MRSILLIFSFCFVSVTLCQDTIQINLSFTGSLFNHGRIDNTCKDKLVFENSSDTNFLSILTMLHSEYMEHQGCTDIYTLKPNIPNGFYRVYIDSILYETYLIDKNERIGLTTHYVISFSSLSDTNQEQKIFFKNRNIKKNNFRLDFYKTETSIIDGVIKRDIKKWHETIDDLSINQIMNKSKSKFEIREIISRNLTEEQSQNLINKLFVGNSY